MVTLCKARFDQSLHADGVTIRGADQTGSKVAFANSSSLLLVW